MIDKNLSQAISMLRMPLALLIIMGHSNILSFPIYSHGEVALYDLSVIRYPVCLFSLVLFGPAVPLFFAISGYLFFVKEKAFDLAIYKSKLKKRVSTLLVPYLIWNIVYVIFNVLVVVSKGEHIDVLSQIASIWGMIGQPFPADPALWFVRDLMVCMVLSPVVYFIAKRHFFYLPFFIIFFSLWLTNSFSDKILPGISISSILFFSIGAILGIKKAAITGVLKACGGGVLAIWASVSFLVLILKDYPLYSTGVVKEGVQIVVILGMAKLIGCMAYLYIAIRLAEKWGLSPNKVDHSFIIFSLHMLLLMILRKSVDVSVPAEISSVMAFGIFVMYVAISFLISWGFSTLIHKNRMATRLLAGGR